MHKGDHTNCGCEHSMRDVIKGIYEMKGENYLSPNNKTMAEGFWTTGNLTKRSKK